MAVRVFVQEILQIAGGHITEPVIESLLGGGQEVSLRALGMAQARCGDTSYQGI
jgi:hypothetical protein